MRKAQRSKRIIRQDVRVLGQGTTVIIRDQKLKQDTGAVGSGDMRAVKGKNGILGIISRDETALFNNAEFSGFLPISNLNEREQHLAEELFRRNVLKKIKRGESIGYQTYAQKEKL